MDSTLGTYLLLFLLAVTGIPILLGMALLGRKLTSEALERLTVIWTVCKVSLVTTGALVLL